MNPSRNSSAASYNTPAAGGLGGGGGGYGRFGGDLPSSSSSSYGVVGVDGTTSMPSSSRFTAGPSDAFPSYATNGSELHGGSRLDGFPAGRIWSSMIEIDES